MHTKINIDLQDTEWELDYIDHDRNIARAIVYDESGQFYFVRAQRDDDFGKATLIETAGGGVEDGEDLLTAIQRELKEENRFELFIDVYRCRLDKIRPLPQRINHNGEWQIENSGIEHENATQRIHQLDRL